MIHLIRALFGDEQGQMKQKIGALYAVLIAFNIGAWAWAWIAFHDYPLLMGTSFLAWSFGLRHAVDADHIAAIDNVTRKLMQAGRRPITVGLMFSLGHSTIVVLASVGIAATALAMKGQMDGFKEVGGLIGTLVSTFFLFAIALMNLFILKSVISAFRRVRRGEPYVEEDLDMLLASRGFLARIFRPLFRLVTRSWHMYFLGFLFGLGFDTATEVGLLGISAASAAKGLPIWSILVFPALFTAGMTLIDTTDSILMLGAYGWAFVKPIRKLYYNITITTVSVVVAIVVGSIEGLGLLADKLQLAGPFWEAVSSLNDNFGLVGYMIVGVFVVSWLCSAAIYRWKRFDEIEVQSGKV
ncbi:MULTISPECIES: HoxN/HupN/NixA family nickel/cobalt transporter [Burkholderia]|uniref:HoxN/HupN/NixA family nickel/cobalt transporter n=1 Tax=Burkholderia TaxID=32008 RepID=UPI0005501A3C|nr:MULTISPECIES: HoxN/HupN/NixA family nickel/cobalt transporter [Burkholderia]TCT27694.1 high-affinity nickel-transport protein [Burkholderia vietnamiensis]SCZ42398.1 high-affinity nickel-transport protein [Burkholderia vietnamiensis]SFY31256.1 high-affinity nickel-transport protein [Burkholderia vietnamiensis]